MTEANLVMCTCRRKQRTFTAREDLSDVLARMPWKVTGLDALIVAIIFLFDDSKLSPVDSFKFPTSYSR